MAPQQSAIEGKTKQPARRSPVDSAGARSAKPVAADLTHTLDFKKTCLGKWFLMVLISISITEREERGGLHREYTQDHRSCKNSR